ncbi:tRNA (N6-threonylcarbamoyladenosine(37)-N6)-methyltransferase TrmO [Otariodibacter oris]|uniref:tRNA-Thr(GGU) m(6)t(6)A37 methyltransferase TsaA n=1 Tax=Otariodibacter oris TaxID=1032623 RepID=A0A420XES5_9PAST|nr:tRNA (N6-threonylcarbamoyladenosine(37)-N6)-methyltransferase TrmO [Otariodibacter oris]QGM80149.1 tRNA-Thr(GGU) m(6)t(6)A37 methyltransferase TsaA [Otariodibacter oris]RKR70495.1 tRNA-Thr(GGU) m(6)t(6)A37 methyltransferase TsaA [Otariodibacter oris]
MQNLIQPIIFNPIGIVETPYGEKFAVPRQPNLVAEGKGILRLFPPYNNADAVRGLDQFSHIWLIFQFDKVPERNWHATVRPPRLGGNERVGVFASRATHRPNPIGLSKVALEKVETNSGEVFLHLGSVDLVNGTPILDIKPYVVYADSEPEASSGFAQDKPTAKLEVIFSKSALQAVSSSPHFAKFNIQQPIEFISQVIAQDPRPAYQQGKQSLRVYGMHLANHNVLWKISERKINVAEVLDVVPLN